MRALQEAVLEMEATQATREKQLLQELEESRAGEWSLRDSVHMLEAEVSELRRKPQSSDDKALSLAIKFNTSELELRKTQAQRDNLRARNQELQQELEESEQAMWRAEHQKTSRETALEKEAIALKEEAVTLHQEVAPLQRKLESLEKERKDVLRERELYEEQMGDLKKKNEMNTPEMRTHKENPQQLEVDREAKQEQLEHGAAALKEWQETAQVLSAALSKSEISKGALKKDLDILKERLRLQQAVGAEGKRLSEHSRKGVECVRDQVAAAAKDKPEKRELRRTFEVSQEQESSSRALEQLHQELAQVCREKELLGQEKAALEGRLAAMECHKQDLSKQLAETRSAKESLESSLFAAQQQISQLEITSNHLEAQVLTVTQAKEALQGEVQCLQRELEAERALRKQEQEDTAQQLLQAEQQCQESLRLQGTAQQVEINKLLQDLASERERHHAEMQETLQQWGKEKAEREQEHEKVLFEMRQKVATLQAQREEERTRFENAKREVLLEKQKEKNSLSETLLQTRGQLSRACQQVQQLRQEVKEQQEKGQTIEAKLQAELQEARREIQAAQKRHKEELRGIKEEMNLLLEQREALQKQVGELTSQLAASRESQATIVQRAQQDVSWAQEQSRQKLLEVEHLQKMLEEAEHQNKELQVHLKNLELEGSQWEEVARQNSGFRASLDALEKEKARLILSLEEKNLYLRTLEEKNQELNNQVSVF
ncbi:centrosome-associated protein CEP250-like [Corvus hawaiiensis]|uniref:centrosome-associated protein CEP250-like n=1 Tax=Corvus hawaiiensis TaxID=134902 RepID=UPI002018D1CD|nr:centrosome-associated protein CEP250-like [Corvus hawaiiensis]XP_048178160.1 centrosome-associated protein CEP250-like [Corvus hawaiiensis]